MMGTDDKNAMSDTAMELKVSDVLSALKGGARVLLMTRHAERPHIDTEDPTFGEALPITPAGERMAFDFGAQFAEIARETDVQFYSSPLTRTRLTSAKIAEGMGVADRWNFETIPCDTLIGNGSPYYADARAVWQIFRGGGFYPLSFEYCATGSQTGFRPLAKATDMLEDFVLSRFTAQLGIFTSHDLFIAAFLSGRGVKHDWTVPTWIHFLDSAAIFISPEGVRRYALVRNEPVKAS